MSPGETGEMAVAGGATDQTAGSLADGAPLLRHPGRASIVAVPLAALAFAAHTPSADAAVAAFMAVVLVVLAAVDLERRIIPNRVVLPATVIVLAARVSLSPGRSLEFAFAAVGIGIVFLIPNLLNSGAIGMGDVKFAALLGAGLGRSVIGAVLVASISLLPFAVGTLIRGGVAARKAPLPFGPFLALGGLVALIFPHVVGHGGI